MMLAHLLRLKLLRMGYIFPPELRAVCDLARKRQQMVRSCTLQLLAFETTYARQTGGSISADAIKSMSLEDVEQWGWDPDVTLSAQANLAAVLQFQGLIKVIEKRLHERGALQPEYRVLKTVPGIGEKGEGNRKCGNAYLSWAFVEAAHMAIRFNGAAKRFYERKKAKTNGAVATKALAHKLARACYHMLKEQTTFDEQRCFA